MNKEDPIICPECEMFSRRGFLQTGGGLAMAGALSGSSWASEKVGVVEESKVKELYESLTADQKKQQCFPVDHKKRSLVTLNEFITENTLDSLSRKQQGLVRDIVKGLTSEEGFKKLMKQMKEDAGGLTGYSITYFGKPGDKGFQFVLSGRHVTLRADGNFDDKLAFGGTMFYGHAPGAFTEGKNHKGNVFWYQALRANEVFKALDGKQRKQALLDKAPHESKVEHRSGPYPGISVGDMSHDQKELVEKVLKDMLALYRKSDVDESLAAITGNGGIDKLCMSFYQQTTSGKPGDIGKDGVWELWRLEGPGFAWHFRGNPHPHGWVNIANVQKKS
jgi:hypothetical protein